MYIAGVRHYKNLVSKLRVYGQLKNEKLILKSTRNKKKEQNVFVIFTINCCLNKFDIACWITGTSRAMVEDAYLDSAAFNSDFWCPFCPAAANNLDI